MLPSVFRKHPIVTKEAQKFIEFGAERHRVFVPLNERGVLTKPISREALYFNELRDDPLPQEAIRILQETQYAPVPIKQFVIGHEYPKELPESRKIPWEDIAKVSLVAIVGVAVAIAYAMMTTLAIGFTVLDPCLIAVLDDGQESWILLAEWDE